MSKKNGNFVNGLIILPDNWVCPAGITLEAGTGRKSFTTEQWSLLESTGAVFLPCCDWRDGGNIEEGWGTIGYYWLGSNNSTASYQEEVADCFYFKLGHVSDALIGGGRHDGYSVRLVKDL